MLNRILQKTLQKMCLNFEADEDNDYIFSISHKQKKYNCLAVSYPAKNLIVFNASLDLPQQMANLHAKLLEILNFINFRLTSGNVEFDGENTVIFRMPCFIPDEYETAVNLCCNILKKFINTTKLVFQKMEKSLNFSSKKNSVSDTEINTTFSHWSNQLEKELDWLYSSECSLSGKERSERIFNIELLVKLFNPPKKLRR